MAYITFQPHDYFNSLLWAGNGSAGRNITGLGFQPDWVWIKNIFLLTLIPQKQQIVILLI